MRNEKGFTLIELIAVVIILGLIALIAIPYFTGSMKTFRDDFYDSFSRTVESAGKEFFKDNTKYLPSKELQSSKVSLSNLLKLKYLNNTDDYEGNECDLDKSYVIVIKRERSSYTYTSCLSCPGDDFSTFSQTDCDGAWAENTQLSVSLGTLPVAYIYKGTSKEEAYQKLKTSVDVVKKNFQGEVIARISGVESGADELYPLNIDVLDTNKPGTYTLNYEFQGTTKSRTVRVYENNAPSLVINKQNVLKAGTIDTTETRTDTGVYDHNDTDMWGQKLVFHFSVGSITNGVGIYEYQWLINNRWETFCQHSSVNATTGACTVTKSDEMVKEVKFRYVDNDGNISKETIAYKLRIDNTPPQECTLVYNKPDGINNWYVRDFNVKATGFNDVGITSTFGGTVKSGIRQHGVGVNGTTIDNVTKSDEKSQTADSKTFKWYGYVEDLAGNYTICKTDALKKDKTNPSCTLKIEGSTTNGWYSSGTPKISFSAYSDTTSGVDTYGIGSISGAHEVLQESDTTNIGYTGFIRDQAGNVSNCTTSLKRDNTNPVVTATKTVTGSQDGVTVRINCSDVTSGCVEANKVYTGVKSNTTYTMKDNAGHSNSVTVQVEKVTTNEQCCTNTLKTCTRTLCDWHDTPDSNGSNCNYRDENYDCYEHKCVACTKTVYN